MNKTACPLDCYDACSIVYKDDKIKPANDRVTNGFLCSHLNHYEKFRQIQNPTYKGEEITLDEAILRLKEIVSKTQKDKILFYKGSGNFGLMQDVSEHFFASYGATLTDGSLCDGAGEAGIVEGRGSNKNMPLCEIEKSDVVIVWGRNPHVTSSHLLPILNGKQVIVIDPIKTQIAKEANLHVQLKPHTDIYLAMLLSRFLHIEQSCDFEYMDKYATEYEDFYELTQNIRIKATLDEIGITLGEIGDILAMVKDKKVAIVCGVGVQKYRDGADVLRAIDAFALNLGLFGKEGCGVAYLGNSKEGVTSPFNTKAKRVSKVDTKFEEFDTVFIQGANPLSQMPDSNRVKNSISHVEHIVYFGLYENETSQVADLVIPAKDFLSKNDIRTSYSHNLILMMSKQKESLYGISEYELMKNLCDEFGVEIESEEFYIEHFKNFGVCKIDGLNYVEQRENIPYKDGFDTDDGEFVFLEEFETISKNDGLSLITPKNAKSLNSQFKRGEFVYVNPALGFSSEDVLKVSSSVGFVELKVKNSLDVREDCVVIYSGTKGVNNLTTSKHSYEGKCAIYQEEKVKLQKVIK